VTMFEINRELLKVATRPHLLTWFEAGTWHACMGDMDRPNLHGRGSGTDLVVAIERAVQDFRRRLAIRMAHEMDEIEAERAGTDIGGEA